MTENSYSGNKPSCNEFHIAEYNSLHGEIRELVAESRVLERQVVFATGAVWAWLAVNDSSVPYIAWFIPLIFSIAGYVRATLLQKHVDSISRYILTIEKNICTNEDCWHGSKGESGIRLSSKVLWILLILITILVPVIIRI